MAFGNNMDPQQLMMQIQRLEARIATLERALEVSPMGLQLRVGASVLQLSPNGVKLNANEVTLASSGKFAIKASGDLVLKGSKIVQN